MKRYMTLANVAVALTFVAATAQAQNTTPRPTTTQTPPATGTQTPTGTRSGSTKPAEAGATADKPFVQKMLMTNMAEIQLGQLAQQKASSSEVKSFAQQMIDDHTKANADLQPIAQKIGVQAPTQLDAKHKALSDKLSKLQGAEFDRQYMQAMVEGHREALKDAQQKAGTKGAMNGSGSTVGTSGKTTTGATASPSTAAGMSSGTPDNAMEYAAKTAPVIQHHLEQAESLAKSAK